ncbi:MAG: Transglutaminase domain-containing protein [Microgenomates group bacterium GW2011_GWA2_46_16]|nr:MAG: Transglutaminase domain-containing protein [Microgenomates group bacterium GW2011_GWA2_46_16]
MSENIYERIHRTLSWKRIVGFNVVLLLVLIIPLSIRLAQQDTENRSGAAGELEPSPIIPPPNYPVNSPTLERVNSFFGKRGDTVVIIGTNFGDYQWGSKVYVGSVEAPKEAVVRWSQSILEVKIPEGARSGKVWVSINGRQATWNGNLILYDSTRGAQIGIAKVSSTQGRVFVTSATLTKRGVVELSYVSEPVTINPLSGVNITNQINTVDNLGKKITIDFEVLQALPSTQTQILEVNYPGIGIVEILRSELYDGSGRLLPLFAEPLTVKLLP